MEIRDENGWILVEYDTALKRGLWCWIDPEDGSYIFQTRYDVDECLAENTRELNDALDPKVNRIGDWDHVASIPVGKFHADLDDAIDNEDDSYIRKYLNDPDNKKFRTSRTRL